MPIQQNYYLGCLRVNRRFALSFLVKHLSMLWTIVLECHSPVFVLDRHANKRVLSVQLYTVIFVSGMQG